MFQYLKKETNKTARIIHLSHTYQILAKIIKKLVHRQLYGFLEFKNLLYTNQFGFRNLHSTNHALITITEKLRKAIDNGEITCGVFLDLQKAFDTVNREIIPSKLEHYGIRGVPLKWFKTFLTQLQ